MSRHTRRRPFCPAIEALEARAVPSVCTVDRPTDVGEGKDFAGDLRYCITQAQDGDSIQFTVKGVINLTRVLPNLTRSISIEGPGADLLTVRRDTGGSYHIFGVASLAATVSIAGLRVSNGSAGGIVNAGNLTLSDSIVSENRGNNSGAIYSTGTLTVNNSTISRNSSGAIYSFRGTLTVNNSTISGNTSSIGGSSGGILSFDGPLTVNDSTISGNTAFDPNSGGGIRCTSAPLLTMISNSTISGNTSAGSGGGIRCAGPLTISNSTVSGNTSGIGSGGGGIYSGGVLTVNNSTISGNIGGGDGGGGIYSTQTLTVNNSTISGNSADFGRGGGIRVGGSMSARNTIIAGNTAAAGPDVFGNLGSRGHNLIGNPQDSSGWHKTDILDVDPQLGPLQDNGGPTWTHALLPGSPALNAGDPAQLGLADQRGVVRSGGVNIGAYQASASSYVFATAHQPFAVGLQAYYAFDGNGLDSSGNGRDLMLVGNPGFAQGKFGLALDLHGNGSQYAVRPVSDPVFDFGSSDFTVQVWVNYSLSPDVREQTLIEKFGDSDQGWTLTTHARGLDFHPFLTAPTTFTTGVWNDVVVVRNGNLVSLFVNGSLIGSTTTSMTLVDSLNPLLIGRRNEADGRDFSVDGKIDDMAIWNRALTADEIATLWNGGAGTSVLTATATVTAGIPFDVTVTAVDPFGQMAIGYTGTVTFATTDKDPGVVLPADYTFTADDQGLHTFAGETVLVTPGEQYLSAFDVESGAYGEALVTVIPSGAPGPRGGGSRAVPYGSVVADLAFTLIRRRDQPAWFGAGILDQLDG